MWSLGISITILATGLRPFQVSSRDDGRSIMDRACSKQHVQGVIGAVARRGCTADLLDLLHRMLSIDPTDRCTMREVRSRHRQPAPLQPHACGPPACMRASPAIAVPPALALAGLNRPQPTHSESIFLPSPDVTTCCD